jgi:hypothetical protein
MRQMPSFLTDVVRQPALPATPEAPQDLEPVVIVRASQRISFDAVC